MYDYSFCLDRCDEIYDDIVVQKQAQVKQTRWEGCLNGCSSTLDSCLVKGDYYSCTYSYYICVDNCDDRHDWDVKAAPKLQPAVKIPQHHH